MSIKGNADLKNEATSNSGETSSILRNTSAKDVADVLRKRILSGHYREDRFIRQELIASELGVSRIPVREALAQLESEGLVVREKYRGAMVPKLSSEEIEEIFELRAILEPYLLRHAIPKITKSQIQELRDIIKRARGMKDIADWAGVNVDFHRTLYRAANKPVASQILENLLIRADRYLKLQTFSTAASFIQSDQEHDQLLDLIEQGDEAGAVAALCDHIGSTADHAPITLGLKSREDDGAGL